MHASASQMVASHAKGSSSALIAKRTCRAPVLAARPSRAAVRVAAESGNGNDKGSDKKEEKIEKMTNELKAMGMTAAKAKQVLKTWETIGVKEPDQLRQLLVKKSLAPVPGLLTQGLLDGVASWGGFYLGNMASAAQDFPFRIGVEALGYFIGIYYGLQVVLEASVIIALLYSSTRYGTNSAALLTAVQNLAGPVSGVGVVDKAARVVNMIKVVQALESVSDLLHDELESSPPGDSLGNLRAYLTLSQAKEKLGFKPEDFELSEKEAGNIAYAFAKYDTNQNFKLEPNEFRDLCENLGKELDADEVKEAVKLLDANNNGYIEFNEFVSWYVKKNGALKKEKESAYANVGSGTGSSKQ